MLPTNNLPFFINDTATDKKAFVISNETKCKNFRIHGDISYVSKEKFTVTAGLNIQWLHRNEKQCQSMEYSTHGIYRFAALVGI